jgi:para-aminobenzoate synthetase/4-amino-4-deoxychorismate lyase
VEVFDPFAIAGFRTVHQMTTGVRGEFPLETPPSRIVEKTFPPGSITGAPKVRTMQIIREVENSPRKVYTGAIGCFVPGGGLDLNVAIRTVIMDGSGLCEMGIGSGIVADSDPAEEYRETVLKSAFLNQLTSSMESGDIDLLETMLLAGDGTLPFLDEHMERMARSADVLGFFFEEDAIRVSLATWLGEDAVGPAVVRLRLDMRGDTWFELLPLPEPGQDQVVRVVLSSITMDEKDPLLGHKTTARSIYDRELKEVRRRGFHEVLFTNNGGELTEGAITSIFVLTDNGWTTPSLDCGLLPGTWRARYLLETKAREDRITPEIFTEAVEVVIGNGVRGKMSVDEIISRDGKVLYKTRG